MMMDSSSDFVGASVAEKKRRRHTFSEDQVSILEQVFKANEYPSIEQLEALASNLGEEVQRLKVWFNNRRSKMKRETEAGRLTGKKRSPTHPTGYLPGPGAEMVAPPRKKRRGSRKRLGLLSSLSVLEQGQVLDVIGTFLERHTEFLDEFKELIPPVDMGKIMEEMEFLLNRIMEALPDDGSLDEEAYKKVRKRLGVFKRTVLEQAMMFHRAKTWIELVRYLDPVLRLVHRLPVFEREPQNRMRDELYRRLSKYFKDSLKHGDFSRTQLNLMKQSLKQHQKDSHGMIDLITEVEDKILRAKR
eukprot:TRINITY_DN864_c0_g1_i3.p1 TRINITY_DN864_c0_g1~~TRINITY_DN864_c0_g1_i3.p1  ORF type:complete len:302 (+),score=89.61 TRINITY_DN864_c0_g1_i3:343-1248(+)